MAILTVLGAQNANVNDRFLSRDEIKSVQFFQNDEFKEIPFFKTFGTLGVPSFCWNLEDNSTLYFTTGNALFAINLEYRSYKQLNVANLRDVHEIDFYDGKVWMSNTYYDELVAYDVKKDVEVKRIKLVPKKESANNILDTTLRNELILEDGHKSKFHTNQVFKSYEGELFALIHHMNGEQLLQKVAQKLLKSQGNGGVINLASGKSYKLNLKAPHSVRLINERYWIFDSGHALLKVYNKQWELEKEIPMAGWGRGGVFSQKNELYYTGVSAKRKRYLSFNEEHSTENKIQIFNLRGELKSTLVVPNVEQVNNLYMLTAFQLEGLLAMKP